MKSQKSNILWNRNKVTLYGIETMYHHMKSKQGNTIWNRINVTADEIETK